MQKASNYTNIFDFFTSISSVFLTSGGPGASIYKANKPVVEFKLFSMQ